MREIGSLAPSDRQLVGRHLWLGWAGLLVFSTLGVMLELLHGFKIPWYIEHASETRRLMWTLAHAHGVLLALLQIAFAATLHILRAGEVAGQAQEGLGIASRALGAAMVLMPLGFFLGGLRIYGGDPSLGVFLVPVGAIALLVAIGLIAAAVRSARRGWAGATADETAPADTP